MKILPIIDLLFLLSSFYFILKFNIKFLYVFILSILPHLLVLLYVLAYTLFQHYNIEIYTFLFLFSSYLFLFPAIIIYALIFAYILTYKKIPYWQLFFIAGLTSGLLSNIIIYIYFEKEIFSSPIPFIAGALAPLILKYFKERKGINNVS